MAYEQRYCHSPSTPDLQRKMLMLILGTYLKNLPFAHRPCFPCFPDSPYYCMPSQGVDIKASNRRAKEYIVPRGGASHTTFSLIPLTTCSLARKYHPFTRKNNLYASPTNTTHTCIHFAQR